MAILAVVNAEQISYLIREDMVNLTTLDKDMNAKPWMVYIDELLYMYNTSNITNMDAVLHQMHHMTKFAAYWCRIPGFYLNSYERNSEAAIRIERINVSDFMPCGAIVKQYDVFNITSDAIVITVPEVFHINISLLEVHLTKFHVHETEIEKDYKGSCQYHNYSIHKTCIKPYNVQSVKTVEN